MIGCEMRKDVAVGQYLCMSQSRGREGPKLRVVSRNAREEGQQVEAYDYHNWIWPGAIK